MIHLSISNSLILTGLSPEMRAVLKKSLTIPNKDYHKMRAMNVWAPESFKYWQEPKGFLAEHNAIEIPRGCLTRLTKWLKAQEVEYELSPNFVHKYAQLGISTLKLRPYQAEIVNSIVATKPSEGVVSSSTGSGKTLMALEIAHRLGLTATILTTNTNLSEQFAAEAKKFYGLDAAVIGGGKKKCIHGNII